MRNNFRFMSCLAAIAAGFVLAPQALANANGAPPIARHKLGKGKNNKRGTGFQARPHKRSNMLTISKRVRRKHRRAA